MTCFVIQVPHHLLQSVYIPSRFPVVPPVHIHMWFPHFPQYHLLPSVTNSHTFCFLLLYRHLFLMHVKEDLHRGHLRMCSEQAEELSALLAQAEFGDYNQNTAKYWYTELCPTEPNQATINR